jgi:hypothetical protein
LDGLVHVHVEVPAGNHLARNAALLSQLMQGILHCDVQEGSQLMGEVSARGTMDQSLRSGQQRAQAGEPSLCLRPQSVVVKAGDFAQGIVSAAMGVAGQIIQRLEFKAGDDRKTINCELLFLRRP